MPGPGHAHERRRKAVHRNEDRRLPLGCTSLELAANTLMVRVEDAAGPHFGVWRRNAMIAGHGRVFAVLGNCAWPGGGAIGVQCQARIWLHNEKGAELGCEPSGHAVRADVPGDMTVELRSGEPEGSQRTRQFATVISPGT